MDPCNGYLNFGSVGALHLQRVRFVVSAGHVVRFRFHHSAAHLVNPIILHSPQPINHSDTCLNRMKKAHPRSNLTSRLCRSLRPAQYQQKTASHRLHQNQFLPLHQSNQMLPKSHFYCDQSAMLRLRNSRSGWWSQREPSPGCKPFWGWAFRNYLENISFWSGMENYSNVKVLLPLKIYVILILLHKLLFSEST